MEALVVFQLDQYFAFHIERALGHQLGMAKACTDHSRERDQP
ncbi:MAG: hypothetical protein ACI81V_001560 [Lentimonas sp.]